MEQISLVRASYTDRNDKMVTEIYLVCGNGCAQEVKERVTSYLSLLSKGEVVAEHIRDIYAYLDESVTTADAGDKHFIVGLADAIKGKRIASQDGGYVEATRAIVRAHNAIEACNKVGDDWQVPVSVTRLPYIADIIR
mgnify:FL=1|jgi:hypothetical protein